MNRADLEKVLIDKSYEDKQGLTCREARQIVSVVLDSVKEALRRGESVDTSLGTFEVIERKRKPLRGWFLGRVRVTYRQRKFIRFTFGEV